MHLGDALDPRSVAVAAVLIAALPGCFRCGFDDPCGDGVCVPGEDCGSCPLDCGLCPAGCVCGDGLCADVCGESCDTCAPDCGCYECWCGDSECDDWCGEDASWCADCESFACACGDLVCEPGCMESCDSCPDDCGPCANEWCGDTLCDSAGGETCENCPKDCGPCAPGIGMHQELPSADGTTAAALGHALVSFTLGPALDFEFATTCIAALPDAPGSGSTSYAVALGGDSTALISLPFAFSYAATSWTSAYVGSNGFVTFGGGEVSPSLTLEDFYALPRVAPLSADLDGGTVIVDEYVTRVSVSWTGWVDAGTGAAVDDFQLTLHSTGEVELAYGPSVPAGAAIAGVAGATGLIGTAVDLVPSPSCP